MQLNLFPLTLPHMSIKLNPLFVVKNTLSIIIYAYGENLLRMLLKKKKRNPQHMLISGSPKQNPA